MPSRIPVVVHQGIPVKLYFGAIKGAVICAAETVQLHGVTGVDQVLRVNMLEVIETSAAPYLEPGETQDECVQHLVP